METIQGARRASIDCHVNIYFLCDTNSLLRNRYLDILKEITNYSVYRSVLKCLDKAFKDISDSKFQAVFEQKGPVVDAWRLLHQTEF